MPSTANFDRPRVSVSMGFFELWAWLEMTPAFQAPLLQAKKVIRATKLNIWTAAQYLFWGSGAEASAYL